MKRPQARNPLLPWTAVVGVAFCLTGWLVYLATVRQLRPVLAPGDASSGERLMHFFAQHGVAVLMTLLALLAVSTLAAIYSDEYWTGGGQDESVAEDREHRDDGGDDHGSHA